MNPQYVKRIYQHAAIIIFGTNLCYVLLLDILYRLDVFKNPTFGKIQHGGHCTKISLFLKEGIATIIKLFRNLSLMLLMDIINKRYVFKIITSGYIQTGGHKISLFYFDIQLYFKM